MIFKVIGDEAEFLSTNNDLELKVLRSVCHEYLKDESVKPIILAAFQTLFDKGFAKFMHQLTAKEKKEFAEKNPFKLGGKQWNLQKFALLDDLDPDGELIEGVILTLTYGLESVSTQSEYATRQLAEAVKHTMPALAKFLLSCMYLDDMGKSKATEEWCRELAVQADEIFAMVGLEYKGWTFSFDDPPGRVAEDGHCIKVGGLVWTPKVYVDCMGNNGTSIIDANSGGPRLYTNGYTVAGITPVISLALVYLLLEESLLEKVPHPMMTFVLAL